MGRKRAVIYGGGTLSHVRPHLSLAAKAYGATARHLMPLLEVRWNVDLRLTKMAGGKHIETTEDLREDVLDVIKQDDVQVIIMSAAVVDFRGDFNITERGRLDSSHPAVLGGLLTLSWRGFLVNLLLGGLIRISLTQHAMFLTNSVCHMFGTRTYQSSDRSGNCFWVVPFNLGSGWHNIHHAFPYTAKNQLRWWQWDPGYWILWLLQRVGLVWDVNTVSPGAEKRKRIEFRLPPHEHA